MLNRLRCLRDDRGDWRRRRTPEPDQLLASGAACSHPLARRLQHRALARDLALSAIALVAGSVLLVALGPLILAVIVLNHLARLSVAREVRLVSAICPACAYSLTSSTPHDDGCTVCPECGGAWRLPLQWHQRPPVLWYTPIRDDRGAWHRPYVLYTEKDNRGDWPLWLPTAIIAPWLILPWVIVACVLLGLNWLAIALGVLGLPATPAILLASGGLRRRRRAARLTRCAICDHPLDNVPPESDGCTVCPACTCAWRMPQRPAQSEPAC